MQAASTLKKGKIVSKEAESEQQAGETSDEFASRVKKAEVERQTQRVKNYGQRERNVIHFGTECGVSHRCDKHLEYSAGRKSAAGKNALLSGGEWYLLFL